MRDGIGKRTLRWTLGIFLLALLIPTALLLHQAYGQLRWGAFYQHRVQAEELVNRIDQRLREIIGLEEARAVAEYGFIVAQDTAAQVMQRSPLASFPPPTALPGLIAYFQIDSGGEFSTPLLPAGGDASAYGISAAEAEQRKALEQHVRQLLVAAAQPGSVAAPAAPAALAKESSELESKRNQAAFERFDDAQGGKSSPAQHQAATGRIADLKLDSRFAARSDADVTAAPRVAPRTADAPSPATANRREVAASKRQQLMPGVNGSGGASVRLFEGEPDPLALRSLDAAHFVLFRKAVSHGERVIQGAVIDKRAFVDHLIIDPFRDTALSRMSDLIVGYDDAVVASIDVHRPAAYSDVGSMRGELLYRTRLSAPLNDFEMVFTIAQLPVGPGGRLIGWVTLVFVLVLGGGLWVVYRFGMRQIELTAQQQDFVSAVSHELKTPLTSIRMYGEMLRAGWADDAKRQSYYDFIYHESERLSRLINNVLRLARLTRNGDDLDLKPHPVTQLIELAQSKVAAQVEQAGFALHMNCTGLDGDAMVRADSDSFVQIIINLIDNALKFSARAEQKVVELGARRQRDGSVVFWVRDYGPGIPKAQMKKIFDLFYRGHGELTRETVGTGIGLALVHELTSAMGGKVGVRNCEPGAEFSVTLPRADVT
jgi:two-component system, OmpR family, phosphate regulon sensor histidine kinase PhoR